jgi:CMP-N-acetylneuraminic acid synthetase
MKIAGLIGVKKNSSSLPGKGWKDFGGKPMFQWNLEKGLKLLDEMYVTSDHDFVLEEANKLGAKLIKRNDPYLMECPNIVYYEYCMDYMDADALIAIQVNSPTVDPKLISITKQLLEMGVPEIITVHKNRDIYGSIWAMTRERLERYADPFTPSAEVFIIDESVDIHSKEDVEKAKEQCQLI